MYMSRGEIGLVANLTKDIDNQGKNLTACTLSKNKLMDQLTTFRTKLIAYVSLFCMCIG